MKYMRKLILFGYMNYMNFVYHSCSLRIQLRPAFLHALYDMAIHITPTLHVPLLYSCFNTAGYTCCVPGHQCTRVVLWCISVLYLQADRGVSSAVTQLYNVIHKHRKSGGVTSQQSTTEHHGTEKHDDVRKCIFYKWSTLLEKIEIKSQLFPFLWIPVVPRTRSYIHIREYLFSQRAVCKLFAIGFIFANYSLHVLP